MATLREIAARAGVSIRTVSRALSGAPDVKAETRAAITRISRELRYTPDPLARGLKLRRGYVVSVIVRRPEELAFAKVCVLERELRAAGYTTQLIFNAGGAEGEAGHLREALAYRPAALVLFSSAGEGSAGHLLDLHASGRPYVLIDASPLPDLDTIKIDRAEGVARAVGRLLDGGHSEVRYLGPHRDDARTEGFLRAFSDRRQPVPDGWGLTGYDASFEGGAAAAGDLAARRPETTAVFAYSDLFAYGVLGGLADGGLQVPGDVSVIGFDDRSPSQYVTPPLSTVAHPHEEVGRLAAEVILGKISGEISPGEGSRTAIPSFVERRSTRDLESSLRKETQ
ncbi:MAG: LacI family DNA-binding transcriptional regulator [Planctomycetota bacterium]